MIAYEQLAVNEQEEMQATDKPQKTKTVAHNQNKASAKPTLWQTQAECFQS